MTLLEELCHWECALGFKIPYQAVLALCLETMDQDVSPWLLLQYNSCLPTARLSNLVKTDYSFDIVSKPPNKCFLL